MTYTELKRKLIKEITITKQISKRGIPYEVFENTPKALRVNTHDRDKRVWVAGFPRNSHIVIKDINDNEIEVQFKGENHTRHFFSDEVVLHPTHWKELFDV